MNSNYFFLALFVLVVSSCNRPVARFTAVEDAKPAPAEIQFENESKKADFYKWTFGDGDSSFLQNPSHIFYKPGVYTVTLEAINDKKSTKRTKNIMVASPEKSLVEIETPYGNMIVELYDDTPQHQKNFLDLTRKGFYDDLLFHRVIDGFMVQGGDPQSRNADSNARLGAGGPGYQVPAELDAGHKHFKGALAAARQGDPVNPEKKSSGSQFYIVHGGPVSKDDLKMFGRRNNQDYSEEEIEAYEKEGGTPFLDGQYTVFGRVIKGLDVIDKIAKTQTGAGDRPVEDITMKITEIK
ncbi:peptidylprolyl isomerase [Membranicola marinus]|uniref:Peptidyl-prolyl cis-trans isomerase n=1 Tax=Membranihabitans marinus TaxID=1227546 RepID=A0A953L855_9BACT|nr:peptidylprolyl isomerase [Membranihabitans marinus]MBY5959442.1 peptidylprolyl isomerase [Membranihabitans marinus]